MPNLLQIFVCEKINLPSKDATNIFGVFLCSIGLNVKSVSEAFALDFEPFLLLIWLCLCWGRRIKEKLGEWSFGYSPYVDNLYPYIYDLYRKYKFLLHRMLKY